MDGNCTTLRGKMLCTTLAISVFIRPMLFLSWLNNLRSETLDNESVEKSGPCATIEDFSVNF